MSVARLHARDGCARSGATTVPVIAVAVAAVVVWPAEVQAQCAMCRAALGSEEGRQLIAAFQSGILFLLAAPFTAFGVVATLAVRSRRRSRPLPKSSGDRYDVREP